MGAMKTITEATNESVAYARKTGIVNAADEGTISVLLKIAERIDDPDYPVIDGRYDNVSVPTYLRYCDALGLTPMSRKEILSLKKPATAPVVEEEVDELAKLRQNQRRRKKVI